MTGLILYIILTLQLGSKFMHLLNVGDKSRVVVVKPLAKDDGADVVGDTAVRQPVQICWRPLVLSDDANIVVDLLLDLAGQHVLTHAHGTENIHRRLALLFPHCSRDKADPWIQSIFEFLVI
jgi:hypothetical protein